MESSNVIKFLEEKLIDDLKSHQSTMIIGKKGSGKTVFANALIAYGLKNRFFNEIHIIAPSVRIDRANTYGWLFEQDLGIDIYAYEKYTPAVIDKIHDMIWKELDVNPLTVKSRLLIMDDFTAYQHASNDIVFQDMVFESRHYKIAIVAIADALKLRNSTIRINFENFILGRIGNRKLLEDIWEEQLSTWMSSKDFFRIYTENMDNREHPLVLINSSYGKMDLKADEYFSIEKQFILNQLNRPLSQKKSNKKIENVNITKFKQYKNSLQFRK